MGRLPNNVHILHLTMKLGRDLTFLMEWNGMEPQEAQMVTQ